MGLDGSYEISVKTPMGNQDRKLVFKTDGSALTGTSESAGETVDLLEGKADGTEFQFKVKQKTPVGRLKVTFVGSLEGDVVSGHVKTPLGKVQFHGKKVS
jgi:hypothetical protein